MFGSIITSGANEESIRYEDDKFVIKRVRRRKECQRPFQASLMMDTRKAEYMLISKW